MPHLRDSFIVAKGGKRHKPPCYQQTLTNNLLNARLTIDMSDSDQNPPTLASLRTRRTKSRTPKATPSPPTDEQRASQLGLLFNARPEPHKTAPKNLPTERRIWTVRDLVSDVRRQIETSYTDLWVEGEISNLRAAPSGHLYFTLKDGEAQLPIVLFRRQALLLRFRPADGLAVLVRGRISIYESRGQLQLIAETLEPRGAGALQLAFEQLKARLLAEGLFDAARKRSLPPFPHCVGIITSPSGAVIRDIVNVVRRRHARLNLLIYPAAMQGPNCCSQVSAGIRWFNKHPEKADLIIIARGGGSIEDLSGFNDEVARPRHRRLQTSHRLRHRPRDRLHHRRLRLRPPRPHPLRRRRAQSPPPSTASKSASSTLEARVHRATHFHLLRARQRLARLSADTVLLRLRDAISRRDQHIDELNLRLHSTMARRLRHNPSASDP